MGGVTVKLGKDDFWEAWSNGMRRHRHHCERKGRTPTERGLAEEGAGTVGEFAVARLLGVAWNPEIGRDHYGSDDLFSEACGAMEVKATEWNTGRLLIYEKTADTLPVILAIVNKRDYTVRVPGWIVAADGKRAEWWEATFRIPCWAVEQHNLRPLEELPCFQHLLGRRSSSPESAPTSAATTGEPENKPSVE